MVIKGLRYERIQALTPDRIRHVALIGVGLAAAAVAGSTVILTPIVAAILLVPLALMWMIQSSYVRFAVVFFGGLVVLQSSEGLDARKLAYLGVTMLALGCSLVRMPLLKLSFPSKVPRAVTIMSIAWTVLVFLSYPIAMMNDVSPINWVRDSVPYLLIAALPLLAFDVTVDLTRRPDRRLPESMLVVYGLLTTVGFTSHWATQRGIADVPISGVLFSTVAVPAMLFCYALAKSFFNPTGRLMWACMSVLVLGLIAVTGTRSSLLLLAAPFIILVFQERQTLTAKLSKGAGWITVMLVFGSISMVLVSRAVNLDLDFVLERFRNLSGITGDSVAGQSFEERSTVTSLAWEHFVQHPLLGMGPGFLFEWPVPYSPVLQSAFTLDSPLAIAAKFGTLGMVALALTLGALYCLQRELYRSANGQSVTGAAIRGYIGVTILLSLLGSPIDDKGFSFAFAFLILIGCHELIVNNSGDVADVDQGIDSDSFLQSGGVVR